MNYAVMAQGEITIRRIAEIPTRCTTLALEGGRYVIGHSETGHHHVLSRTAGVDVFVLDHPPEGMRILYAIVNHPTSLDHLRGYDTHAPVELAPGKYEFRIAREYDPYADLARSVAD